MNRNDHLDSTPASDSRASDLRASAAPASDPVAFDVFSAACDSRSVLSEVTGRWGALTLVALVGEPLRFADLRRRVGGISERMLSQTLHALEADGLIRRTVHSQIPPHVEYDLTALGKPLASRLAAVVATIYDLMPELLNHRVKHAADFSRTRIGASLTADEPA